VVAVGTVATVATPAHVVTDVDTGGATGVKTQGCTGFGKGKVT